MKRVGIRELRQNASALLRRVEGGETIEITDRGRLVALLSPAPSGGALERLRAAGKTVQAERRLEDLPAPVAMPEGVSLSDLLEAQREERLTSTDSAEQE